MARALQLLLRMPGRERILEDGTSGLSEHELLALLVGGGEPDLLAARLLREGLCGLRRTSPIELVRAGCRAPQAARVAAALELGRRSLAATGTPRRRLLRAEDAGEVLWPHLAHLRHEEFWCVVLSARLDELGAVRIAQGGITQCSILPREAFLPAILRGAPAVIFAHNHPSGDPTPSPDDYRLQLMLEEAGRALGIDVPDHIVIGETGVHSARSGFSPPPPPLREEHPIVPHPGVESIVE